MTEAKAQVQCPTRYLTTSKTISSASTTSNKGNQNDQRSGSKIGIGSPSGVATGDTVRETRRAAMARTSTTTVATVSPNLIDPATGMAGRSSNVHSIPTVFSSLRSMIANTKVVQNTMWTTRLTTRPKV